MRRLRLGLSTRAACHLSGACYSLPQPRWASPPPCPTWRPAWGGRSCHRRRRPPCGAYSCGPGGGLAGMHGRMGGCILARRLRSLRHAEQPRWGVTSEHTACPHYSHDAAVRATISYRAAPPELQHSAQWVPSFGRPNRACYVSVAHRLGQIHVAHYPHMWYLLTVYRSRTISICLCGAGTRR